MPGTKVKVAEAYFANEKYFGAEKPSDWKSYVFYTEKQETVTAGRKGLVVEVVENFEAQTSKDIEYTTKKNYVLIEHEDGTLLRYMGFQKDGINVAPGDEVVPGTALGILAPTDSKYFQISLLLYHLASANFESLQGASLSQHKSLYKILRPQFNYDSTQTGFLVIGKEYTASNSEEYIE